MPDKLRLLVAIANYGSKNDEYLARVVAEYRSMPYDVDVVLLSNIRKELGPGVEVVVGLPARDPWSLPFAHRQIFANRLSDYDIFIYSEDDILITGRNVRAFLRVQGALPKDEIPGFMRYEQGPSGAVNYPDVHGVFHWAPDSVRRRGEFTLAFFTNEHSAAYMVAREQLEQAINSGGFLVKPHQGKYDLLCTGATDIYTECGLQKLICISHLDEFLIHHLPNKYVGTAYGVDDHELRRQIQVLLRIGQNGCDTASLFQTESKLKVGRYSKNYYEPVVPEVIEAIPSGVRSVLSIGCGWGAMESHLAKKGLRVFAVPLDPVIPGGAESAGVEIIPGDFAHALRELAGTKFDCLLLSNVLHLVPNPTEVLLSFAALLPAGGTTVAVAPNMARLASTWKALRGDPSAAARGGYEKTGVHRVSQGVLRDWFRSTGMKVEKVLHLVPESAGEIRRLALSVLRPWMADEFVVVARKRAVSSTG
jgi:2-polyprenyl-3-methyl-5-hydroxy-6-metoxy-1,4-benzoquinol methylase